jgi:hypothetical protein
MSVLETVRLTVNTITFVLAWPRCPGPRSWRRLEGANEITQRSGLAGSVSLIKADKDQSLQGIYVDP